MPKTPIDSIIDGLDKVQKVHTKAEEIRRNFEHMNPLQVATDVVSSITDKVNELDALAAKTRRRVRRAPPKTG